MCCDQRIEELSKELKLYRSMTMEKFVNERRAEKFVDAVLRARKEINESQLRRNKYNLIKELKTTFNIEDFFKSRVTNYKLQASIYKLFEYAEADDPKDYIESKFALIEHVQRDNDNKNSTKLFSENKDVRILTSKLIIDKFNQKYSNLSSTQKVVLREFINNVTNSENLKKFIVTETKKLQKNLSNLVPKISSKIIRIKINEVIKLLDNLQKKHLIEDKDVLTILRYHELVKELKR